MRTYQADTVMGLGAFLLGTWAITGYTEQGIVWGGIAMLCGALLIAVGMSRW